MRIAFRCLAVALSVPALVPAVAHGSATVEVDEQLPLLRITEDPHLPGPDHITIVQTAQGRYTVSASPGSLTSNTCNVIQTDTSFDCPREASIAVDLGSGADTLDAARVSDPLSAAGGAGDDTLSTG